MRLLAGVFLLGFLPFVCAAQLSPASMVPEPSLSLSPAYPNPNTPVTIEFQNSTSGAAAANYRWSYNGTAISTATNQRSITVRAPEAGMSATVKLAVESAGLTKNYQVTISPLYLDLIIEPQTHVPEFYIGRALPSVGSQIKVTALLSNGTPLGTNYTYTWRINDVVYGGGPLRSTPSIIFAMPQGQNATLSLQVSTPSGTTVAKRTILVPSVKPELVFYELNTLYGLETSALKKGFNLISNSAILRAEPYYLDSVVFNTPSLLNWSINQKTVSNPSANPYEITIERSGTPGDATVGFEVRSLRQLLQGIRGSVEINL